MLGLNDGVLMVPCPSGGSSGIGLATVKLLLEVGANIVVGDRDAVPITHDALTFVETEVGSWSALQNLFNKAVELHGRVDHVFANAGISGNRAKYFDDVFDETTGELLEPNSVTLDINLKAVINTTYLGMHHMRHQSPPGGSIVCTASASSFQRFRNVDYAVSKHGVLGFMRGVVASLLVRDLSIRVNCISPSWTRTGMVTAELLEGSGALDLSQDPESVAKSVAILMADQKRQGQVIYSKLGQYMEIEESRLLPLADEIVGQMNEDVVLGKIEQYLAKVAAEKAAKKAAEEASENMVKPSVAEQAG